MSTSTPPPNTPLLIKMEQHAIISVSGPDATKFLQGQCTCDIHEAEQGRTLLGAHCTPKGRVICNFIINKTGENQFGLRMRADIIESSLESLKKYSVFFKVELCKSELTPTAIIKPKTAMTAISTIFSLATHTPKDGSSAITEKGILSRHNHEFLEIWANPAQTPSIYSQLSSDTHPGEAEDLNRYLINQGIIDITTNIQSKYTPQDLNYQLINALSFKKGCYTGQEIIARLHYRGKLKKHAYLSLIETTTPVNVGSTIVDPGMQDKDVGTVVASSPAKGPTPDHHHALIITSEDSFKKNEFFIEKNSKAKISWQRLPYAIT